MIISLHHRTCMDDGLLNFFFFFSQGHLHLHCKSDLEYTKKMRVKKKCPWKLSVFCFMCFLWLTRTSYHCYKCLAHPIHKKSNESLTNLLELLFLTVLALPKASSSGLDCRMMSLTCCEETDAMSF